MKKSIPQILAYLATAVDVNTIRVMALKDLQKFAGRKCGSTFMNALVAESNKNKTATPTVAKISKDTYTVLNATQEMDYVVFPDRHSDPVSASATVADFLDLERNGFPDDAVEPVSALVTPINADLLEADTTL